MFYMLKIKKIYPAYVTKDHSNREKQVILLMIPNGEGWHYLAVKKLSALSREITSKHHSDSYCLNCLHSFAAEKNPELHKKVCKNEDFCRVIIPSKDTKILEFTQYQISDKAPFIIYVELEYLIEKIDVKIILKSHLQQNEHIPLVGDHIPSGFSMSTISSFKTIENEHGVYRGKDCMKMFCESLRDHAMKIINFKNNY